MKKALALILLLAVPVSALFAHDPATDMATAAKLFIKSLDEKAKKAALLPLNGKGRETWTYLPD